MSGKKYEFGGVITSRKESMFEEKIESPTETTVVDYEKFKEIKLASPIPDDPLYLGYRVYDGMKLLKNKFNLQHFMSCPVDLYKGKPIQAMTAKGSEFKGILERFQKEIEDGNEIFLYDLMYTCPHPTFHVMDGKSFSLVELDFPIMTEGFWKVRYGTLRIGEE